MWKAPLQLSYVLCHVCNAWLCIKGCVWEREIELTNFSFITLCHIFMLRTTLCMTILFILPVWIWCMHTCRENFHLYLPLCTQEDHLELCFTMFSSLSLCIVVKASALPQYGLSSTPKYKLWYVWVLWSAYLKLSCLSVMTRSVALQHKTPKPTNHILSHYYYYYYPFLKGRMRMSWSGFYLFFIRQENSTLYPFSLWFLQTGMSDLFFMCCWGKNKSFHFWGSFSRLCCHNWHIKAVQKLLTFSVEHFLSHAGEVKQGSWK